MPTGSWVAIVIAIVITIYVATRLASKNKKD